MALSAAVFVGGIAPWKDELIAKAKKLKVAPGNVEGADIGPLISPEARQRCIDLITSAEKDVSPTGYVFAMDCLVRVPGGL
jgi:malonate-semialdehyde dehydrogenase (acetylating)/methylmalonate-semialdehyde dehydrogenase